MVIEKKKSKKSVEAGEGAGAEEKTKGSFFGKAAPKELPTQEAEGDVEDFEETQMDDGGETQEETQITKRGREMEASEKEVEVEVEEVSSLSFPVSFRTKT